MRWSAPLSALLWALSAAQANCATSWSFDDATVSIIGKKGVSEGAPKEKLAPNKQLKNAITLGSNDNLKILLTTKEGKTAKRPHQTFLNLKDSQSGLETSFSFQIKENGRGKLELSQKDVPIQLLEASTPLTASLVIASFGTCEGYDQSAFDLKIDLDPSSPLPSQAAPLRYGKLPEIHHMFKSDPKNPPRIISLVFTLAVLLAFPALLVVWLSLGANTNHLTHALRSSPLAHTAFFGSILAMEAVFFMYYTSWTLFQTLPAATGVGLVTFLSGSRALTEVQARRLSGLR